MQILGYKAMILALYPPWDKANPLAPTRPRSNHLRHAPAGGISNQPPLLFQARRSTILKRVSCRAGRESHRTCVRPSNDERPLNSGFWSDLPPLPLPPRSRKPVCPPLSPPRLCPLDMVSNGHSRQNIE